MTTYSAAELFDFNKDAFENALNKYRFIKSEEYAMEFENSLSDFQSFLQKNFDIHVECNIDFFYNDIGEPSVIASELYANMKDGIIVIVKNIVDMFVENYQQATTAEEFIEYATFEDLEFDENGNWVDGDGDDNYFKPW